MGRAVSRSFALLGLAALALAGCMREPNARGSQDGAISPSADAATPPRSCIPRDGVDRSPETIEQVVTLINALPSPVTIPCFLESLERPLYVEATTGRFSAQPASGDDTPRVFLFLGDLVLTIVPEGRGAPLLEMGQFVDATRSRKAEVEFPVTLPLVPAAPYERIGTLATVCSACHGAEVRDESIVFANAFVSRGLRPRDDELMPLDALRAEWLACDPLNGAQRCSVLDALFDHGEVLHRAFSADVATF